MPACIYATSQTPKSGSGTLSGKVLWPCGSGLGTPNVADLWTLAAREPVTRVYVH